MERIDHFSAVLGTSRGLSKSANDIREVAEKRSIYDRLTNPDTREMALGEVWALIIAVQNTSADASSEELRMAMLDALADSGLSRQQNGYLHPLLDNASLPRFEPSYCQVQLTVAKAVSDQALRDGRTLSDIKVQVDFELWALAAGNLAAIARRAGESWLKSLIGEKEYQARLQLWQQTSMQKMPRSFCEIYDRPRAEHVLGAWLKNNTIPTIRTSYRERASKAFTESLYAPHFLQANSQHPLLGYIQSEY